MPASPQVTPVGRRPVFAAVAAILGVSALLAPARIIYKHNQDVKTATGEVAISNFAFDPPVLTVKSGTTVTFTNRDGTAHTVTSDDGSFDLGRIPGGASVEYVVTANVSYHCDFHHNMRGSIVVEG